MIKHMRCPACGRHHKRGHEKRVDTAMAYSPYCIKLPRHPENRSGFKLRYRQIHCGSLQPK